MTGHHWSVDDVSRETSERLEHLVALVEKWNGKINLISKTTEALIWDRHITDSAQIFRLAPDNAGHWADFGSGGGFPGLVVAILAHTEKPELHLSLVESDTRKCAFLRTAVRELGLKTKVLAKRIEEIEPLHSDVISARALASLPKLLGFVERHAANSCTALFPKGKTWEKELSEARLQWSFRAESIKSITEPEAVILKLSEVARV